MENRFEHIPPEERSDWGHYVRPPGTPENTQQLGDARSSYLCVRVQSMIPHLLEHDGEVRPEIASSAQAHIATCAQCARYYTQMQQVISLLETLEPPEMPVDFAPAIRQRIQAEYHRAQGAPRASFPAASLSTGREEAPAGSNATQQQARSAGVRRVRNVRLCTASTLQTHPDEQTVLTGRVVAFWRQLTGTGLLLAVLGVLLLTEWGRQAIGVNLDTVSALLAQIVDAVAHVPVIGSIVAAVAAVLTQAAGILHATYRASEWFSMLGLAIDISICVVGYYLIVARRRQHRARGA
ncbi:MAG: hypothetical protein RMJ43_05190 [Chloroherpetonaceae bacterium]|nr:hypothetical protein [Chthonomonadaceae bacterium]MDW8207211.1 hypothetical protein [Chloroherpetonaceae bacterium]